MSITRAIFIQGCARSGNTLMRELCASSFCGAKLTVASNESTECSLLYLVKTLKQEQTTLSPSRLAGLFFSTPAKPSTLLVAGRDRDASLSMDVKLLRANPSVKVLWMLRNPLDVLTSIHARFPGEFYVKPQRLLQSLELYQRFEKEPQVMTIRYEELVADPDSVQAKIAQALKIEPLRNFTEAHKYFTHNENIRAMHSFRPVDTNSVQKWKTNPEYKIYLQKVLAENPQIISIARDCGYEVNLD